MQNRATNCSSWWAGEEIAFLTCLPKTLTRHRDGRRMHVASIYLWASPGLRGVRLRTFMVGGRMATTREEVDRFFAALTRGGSAVREGLAEDLRERGLA